MWEDAGGGAVRAGARVEAWSMPRWTRRRTGAAPQRTGSSSGRQAQAALFSLVRYVTFVRASARSAPRPVWPAGQRAAALPFPPSGVSRVRARAQRPARPRGEKALFSRIGRDFYFVGRPTGLLVSTVSRLEHV